MRRIRLTLVGLMICAGAQASSPQRFNNVDSLVYLQRESFIVWYSPAVNVPALVAWSLSGSDLGRCHRPAGQNFLTDFDCPKPRAKSSDYRRSGYQRGHLCPSADRSSSTSAMRATFIMSNVAPMTPAKLNTCSWAQAEEYSRIVARAGHRCFLVAGALIPDSVCHWLPSARIAIPDSFFQGLHRYRCAIPECVLADGQRHTLPLRECLPCAPGSLRPLSSFAGTFHL